MILKMLTANVLISIVSFIKLSFQVFITTWKAFENIKSKGGTLWYTISSITIEHYSKIMLALAYFCRKDKLCYIC